MVCATDLHAVAVLHAVWRAGLRPGADLGIIGFDDSELARMHELSSVAQPLGQVASTALALVAEALSPPLSRSAADVRTDGVLLRPGLTAREQHHPHPLTPCPTIE